MLETLVLLVVSLVLGIGSLVWAGWLVLAGQFQTFDGLFLTLVCLVLALVFFVNCIWNIRSQEFKEWLQGRERKESGPEAKRSSSVSSLPNNSMKKDEG